MPRYPKPLLFSRVSDQLSVEISSGDRRGQLPGIRVLMKDFKVSKQTMMQALNRLEEHGYLAPSEPGRARKILPVKGLETIMSANRPLRVIQIYNRPKDELSRTDMSIMTVLKKKVRQSGRIFESVYYPDISNPGGVHNLSELLKNNPADLYLVTRVHEKCAAWLAQSSYPVVYLSGDLLPECLPRVTYHLEEMLTPVIKELVKLGHRRIVYMQHAEQMNESLELSSAGRVVHDILLAQGVQASHYNCPQWGSDWQSFKRSLENAFKLTAPTALIVSEPWMIMLCLCLFVRLGLRYPEDVSLVCLERSPLLENCFPPISCIQKSFGNYSTKVMRVIDEMLLGGRRRSQSSAMGVTEFQKTSSIGKVRYF